MLRCQTIVALQALIAELEAEIEKIQKQSRGSESVRARLIAMREREAQTRSVLQSGELPAGLLSSHSLHPPSQFLCTFPDDDL